jgi:hypothetical protein
VSHKSLEHAVRNTAQQLQRPIAFMAERAIQVHPGVWGVCRAGEWVRQNFGLGHEDVAVAFLISSQAERELLVTAATKLKEASDWDLLEFKSGKHGE